MSPALPPAAARHLRRAAAPAVLVNLVAPFAAYEILTALGTTQLTALAVGSLFPAAGIVATAVRQLRLDGTALLGLTAIAVGLAVALLTHSAWFLVVHSSLVTGTIGLVFLVSLAAPRPMTFVLGRQLAEPARRAAFEERWGSACYRTVMRTRTAAWGAALVVHATGVILLSLVLTPGATMVASPLLAVVVLGPVAVWTTRVRRRAARA